MLRYTRDGFLNELIVNILQPLFVELELSEIPIIITHQNYPAPTGVYVAIEYSGNWRRIGRTDIGKLYAVEEEIEEEGETETITVYKQLNLSEYEINIILHEVNGEGDILTFILDYLDTPKYQEKFVTARISFLGNGQIISMPFFENNRWEKESTVELRFAVATGIENEQNTVEQINFENNIDSEE